MMLKREIQGARYVTRGISGSLTYELQLLIWELIDQLDVEQDYLQVFKLVDKEGEVKLTHRQEQPDYSKLGILFLILTTFGSCSLVIWKIMN